MDYPGSILGLILAAVVHAASCQDYDGARVILRRLQESSKRLRLIFADSAYGRDGLADWVKTTMG